MKKIILYPIILIISLLVASIIIRPVYALIGESGLTLFLIAIFLIAVFLKRLFFGEPLNGEQEKGASKDDEKY